MANEKKLFGPTMNAVPPRSGQAGAPPRIPRSPSAAPQRSYQNPAAGQIPYRPANTNKVIPGMIPTSRSVQAAPTTKTIKQPVVSPAISQSESANSLNGFVNAMLDVVGGFALLSEEVLSKNMDMAVKTLPNSDKTISFECIDYLMSNLGVIVMGLILDNTFKESFKEAVMLEMQLDVETPESRAQKRASMKADNDYESAGSIVIGVTSFTPAVEKQFMDKMQHSFDMMDPYSEEFDAEVAKLTEDQKIEFGFIFSNFMYLIRAFILNGLFMSYVITVVEKVKSSLNIA